MQQLAIEQRRLLGPRAPWHVGDVAWGLHQHEGREDEWTIRLWRDGDRVVAWSWLKRRQRQLELDVRPDRRDLLDEILAEPARARPSAFEDDERAARGARAPRLRAPGRAAALSSARDSPSRRSCRRCREGFRYRTVEPADLAERVAIHRDVWAPSRVTESSYANVMAAWPYRELARLRRRGARRPLRRVLPRVAGRRERRRRARAGRRARGVPPPRPRRRRLHVRAAAPVRGGRTPGDRLLRDRSRRARSTASSASDVHGDHRRLRRDEPPRAGDEPVPPPARREPGRLVPVGRRGVRARPRRGQADPALGRLLRLPLVPRDGARVVRGRGDGAS